ncbi:MAG: nuclear transport factor 2 family protein, partial [Flavisolibacter sp.]
QQNEKAAIEKAILNYVEAFYEADTTKAYESIVRDLAKRGYFTTKEGKNVEAKMSFEQLVRLAQRWKQSQNITAETPRKITVFEILDKIATAKVEAKWGIDYFHLARLNGKWMIVNVLWQDYPKANGQ